MLLLHIFSTVCLPIFSLIGLGWGLDRIFGLDLRTMVRLNLYLFVPAFILVRLSTSALDGAMGMKVIGFTLSVIATMGLLSWLVCLITRQPASRHHAVAMGTMIYNCGNWGIALTSLAFTSLGPVLQVLVLATMNATSFTLGIFLANAGSERREGWFLPVLRQPSPYAIIAALLLRGFGNPMQNIPFLWRPLSYIADGLVGFALITLGVQLSQTKPPAPTGNLAAVLSIRLVGGPLAALGLCWIFGFRGEAAAILILGAAAPTAVNTALLTHEFGGDSRFAAAAVLYSTLLAGIVATLLLAMLRAGWIPWAMPIGAS